MDIFKTLLGWASGAWSAITGAAGDVAKIYQQVWHYITSVHNLLSWIAAHLLLPYARTALTYMTGWWAAILAIHEALGRIAGYIWVTEVRPVRDQLRHQLAMLYAWAVREFQFVIALIWALIRAERAQRIAADVAERNARIKADKAEAAARILGDKTVLATVQRQAASGYNATLHTRLGLLGTVLDQIANHNPAVKTLVSDLIKGVVDLETIDDPVLRWVLAKVISELIDKLGVDRIMGEFAQRLLSPLIGQPRAGGLEQVTHDIGDRLDALEAEWAQFMADGGPEVEQAGKEWKSLTGPVVDAALLGFLGLGIADPAAWATGVADSIGVVGNDALIGIIDLLKRG